MGLRYAKRLFDKRPIACHLYVTDRCNLSCGYCREYDNTATHPRLDDLKRWSRKARELGCLHIGLRGGEPLLHPDIVSLVGYCRALGLSVSLSTNGCPLTQRLAWRLGQAGLGRLHVSVDRMSPSRSTRKSLEALAVKLDFLRLCPFRVVVTGVLFEETLEECDAVLDGALDRGFSAHFRLVHPGPGQEHTVGRGPTNRLRGFLNEMMMRKATGQPIHTSWAILDYQRRLLSGEPPDWTCAAGYKHFFISSKGKFWPCSMVRTEIDIESLTVQDLSQWYRKKSCQTNCGVYCVISASMLYERPVRCMLGELGFGAWRNKGSPLGHPGGPRSAPIDPPPQGDVPFVPLSG